LVDALDSKSSFFGSAGSIPALSTIKNHNNLTYRVLWFFYALYFRHTSYNYLITIILTCANRY